MDTRPKNFVLDLLSARGPEGLPVSALVRGAEVMGVQSNALRVSLSRLKRAGFVECDARGWYALGEAAKAIHEQVQSWRQLEARTRKWDGSWIAVHLDRLPSNQRKQQRLRSRALELLGFAQWRPGLAVRPNNLREGIEGVRQRLRALGVGADQPVFRLDECEASLAELWDGEALNRRYREGVDQLAASRLQVEQLELEAAAAETFRVGGAALRTLAFDPLLPAPIIDRRARRRYAKAVEAYDRLGREYWSTVLDAPLQPPRGKRRRAPSLQSFSTQLEA